MSFVYILASFGPCFAAAKLRIVVKEVIEGRDFENIQGMIHFTGNCHYFVIYFGRAVLNIYFVDHLFDKGIDLVNTDSMVVVHFTRKRCS